MTPEELAANIAARPFSTAREQLMQQILLAVEASAKRRTPVRTGTLRRSIATRQEGGGVRGYVGTNIRYARPVHDGTRHMAGRPFLAQGIEDSRGAIEKILGDVGAGYLEGLT